MDDYKRYLAENILTEDKVITYRLLSRALKVHVNTAKQMLYEFHKSQNGKRPGVVHATYLIYGVKKAAEAQVEADGDVEMASSLPDAESLAEVVPTFVMALVQEARLKDVLAEYDEVTSIHVYSVGPHPANDLVLLSDVARQVLDLSNADDSASTRSLYGTITNSHVRRRERRNMGANVVAAPIKHEPKPALFPAAGKSKDESESAAAPAKETAPPTTAKKPPPLLKRGSSGGSGIMQAFSKAKPKAVKAEPAQVDTPMSDDGEDDGETPQPTAQTDPDRKSKKEREEELKRMMEDDDEEEDQEDQEERPETPIEEPIEEEAPAPEPAKEEPAEILSTSGDGRRRGKRRVMRKKQVMDDQGYLVTIQEPGWESFSEDEAQPAVKAKPDASAAPAAAAKGKKAAPKAGQGNIMSFFSKK